MTRKKAASSRIAMLPAVLVAAVTLAALILVGLISAGPQIIAHPVEWLLVLAAMVMCSMFTVRISTTDPMATFGITSAMIGVLSPAESVTSVLLLWIVGGWIGFVLRRRGLHIETLRIAMLLPPALVYLLTWIAVSPDPRASFAMTAIAATVATIAYAAVGIIAMSISAAVRRRSLSEWWRSLRLDLAAAMVALNIAVTLVATAITRFLEGHSQAVPTSGLPAIDAILVIALLGTAALAVDGLVEARVAQRRLDGIVAAATNLPWPLDRDQVSLAMALAKETVKADKVFTRIEAGGNSLGAISAPLALPDGTVTHLVATRSPGRSAFLEIDHRALTAIAGIAAESMRTRTELDELALESQTDPLTKLANYRGLQSALLRIRGNRTPGRGIAVIYIDMDGFKQVNDHFGHQVGNEVLKTVAERLLQAVRPSDTVARVGGDEFLVLLSEVDDKAHAESIAERIRRTATVPIWISTRVIPIGFSIGIAFSDDHSVDPAVLVDRADVHMYRARGLRQIDDNDYEAPESLDVSQTVESAINDRNLAVEYQPIVDASSGLVTAVEALVRFRHPQLGMLPPPLLVREARRLGLLTELTVQVLEAAFADISEIGIAAGPLHVNVHIDELTDERFIAALERLRRAYPGVRLLLELGENSLHRTSPEAIQQIAMLRDSGILIALDDFGRAHSTMVAIAQLPVDVIKIDRGLIQGIEDPRSQHLISSLNRLAKRLLIRVVVEGVETEAERNTLMALGIAEMQGFFFARPMPIAELCGFISSAKSAALERWQSTPNTPKEPDQDWD